MLLSTKSWELQTGSYKPNAIWITRVTRAPPGATNGRALQRSSRQKKPSRLSISREDKKNDRRHWTKPLRGRRQTEDRRSSPHLSLSTIGSPSSAGSDSHGRNGPAREPRSRHDAASPTHARDMQVRNLSPHTQRAYTEQVTRFAQYFHHSCGIPAAARPRSRSKFS